MPADFDILLRTTNRAMQTVLGSYAAIVDDCDEDDDDDFDPALLMAIRSAAKEPGAQPVTPAEKQNKKKRGEKNHA